MSGIGILDKIANRVDCLIIDEASQCIEPSALIPFRLNPKRVILAGD